VQSIIDFIKTLINNSEQKLTFVLFDKDEPESYETFKFKPINLFMIYGGSIVAILLVVVLLLKVTPLGYLIFGGVDEQLRSQVIDISKKVRALDDSLRNRDRQLSNIKQVLVNNPDTTFKVSETGMNAKSINTSKSVNTSFRDQDYSEIDNYEMLSHNQIIFSKVLSQSPDFPAEYPLKGTFTRGYNREEGHNGIDIAAKNGTEIHAIAEGAVINTNWTVNYGYVIRIQHGDGFISVYKHCADLTKDEGDIVMKGDIIGTVGNAGVMSSGPHLHFELWKNGIPLDPRRFLENN